MIAAFAAMKAVGVGLDLLGTIASIRSEAEATGAKIDEINYDIASKQTQQIEQTQRAEFNARQIEKQRSIAVGEYQGQQAAGNAGTTQSNINDLQDISYAYNLEKLKTMRETQFSNIMLGMEIASKQRGITELNRSFEAYKTTAALGFAKRTTDVGGDFIKGTPDKVGGSTGVSGAGGAG
jgi:hypothetical protein